jgi:hypothetical protein
VFTYPSDVGLYGDISDDEGFTDQIAEWVDGDI